MVVGLLESDTTPIIQNPNQLFGCANDITNLSITAELVRFVATSIEREVIATNTGNGGEKESFNPRPHLPVLEVLVTKDYL